MPLVLHDRGHAFGGVDADPGGVGGTKQRVDNRLRAVGIWEHPTVGLGFQRDTTAGEPFNGVRRTESVERTNQSFLTTWIIPAQLTRLETIVRDIAATTARDLHLLQQLRRLLEDQNRFPRLLRAGDRRKESCCASAHNDEVKKTCLINGVRGRAGWHRRRHYGPWSIHAGIPMPR